MTQDEFARGEIGETQALITGYRPGPSFTESIEGEIARNEADAQAARDARYRYESESLTGGGGPGPGATETPQLCYPGGNPVGEKRWGTREYIRTLGQEEFAQFVRQMTRDATEIETPAGYKGVWYRRSDGDVVGARMSTKHGLTVDIIRSNSSIIPPKFKVHTK